MYTVLVALASTTSIQHTWIKNTIIMVPFNYITIIYNKVELWWNYGDSEAKVTDAMMRDTHSTSAAAGRPWACLRGVAGDTRPDTLPRWSPWTPRCSHSCLRHSCTAPAHGSSSLDSDRCTRPPSSPRSICTQTLMKEQVLLLCQHLH